MFWLSWFFCLDFSDFFPIFSYIFNSFLFFFIWHFDFSTYNHFHFFLWFFSDLSIFFLFFSYLASIFFVFKIALHVILYPTKWKLKLNFFRDFEYFFNFLNALILLFIKQSTFWGHEKRIIRPIALKSFVNLRCMLQKWNIEIGNFMLSESARGINERRESEKKYFWSLSGKCWRFGIKNKCWKLALIFFQNFKFCSY